MSNNYFVPTENVLRITTRNARDLTRLLVEEAENSDKLKEMVNLPKEELILKQQIAYTIAQGYWNAIIKDKELEALYAKERVLAAANEIIDYAEAEIIKFERKRRKQEQSREELKRIAKNTNLEGSPI